MKDSTTMSREERQLKEAVDLIKTPDFDGARSLLQRIVGQKPECARAFNLLGVIHEKLGDMDAARRMYRVALDIDPTYHPAHGNLSRLVQYRTSFREPDLGDGDGEGADTGRE